MKAFTDLLRWTLDFGLVESILSITGLLRLFIIIHLGIPTIKQWESMDADYSIHRHEFSWIMPSYNQPDLWLAEFIRYDPKRRISAKDALVHEYFNDLNKSSLPTRRWDGSKAIFDT
ncbi:unnamed protein product [Dracunculus medinensis]|uniref:Protein kinase domain-containing protein n=1 Tax=Dracunculus medinensis TaxID=318479 RepID=A0A0N4U8K3_DRAME|nr:unnamed protein product [Dracunculus medinensis]